MTSHRISGLWGRVLSEGVELPLTRVALSDGRIMSVETSADPQPGDIVVEDGWIAPGLIDVQVNGAAGVDLTSAPDPATAVVHVARTLARNGVTAFCPTVISSRCEVILDRLGPYAARPLPAGATSLGAHIEGPFLDTAHRGVHDPAVLRDATESEISAWLAAGRPAICTLAPERSGGLRAIEQLVAAGVVVSLGHSGADAAEGRAGLAAGARMATHVFNAMPPLHHRQPGLVGVLLASTAVLGLIGDGMHVDPLMVDLVVRRAGPRRVALVSVALAAAGSPPGPSVLGDQTVVSDGQVVRRVDGTLAGCALLLDQCIRNLRRWLPDVPPASLIEVATSTPARLLGRPDRGRVATGAHADLIVLADDFSVRQTIVRGELIDVTV